MTTLEVITILLSVTMVCMTLILVAAILTTGD